MGEGEALEAARQALTRPLSHPECRRAGGDDMDEALPPDEAIPFALEVGGPIVQQMHFIDEKDRRPVAGGLFCHPRPCPFAAAGERGFRAIGGEEYRRVVQPRCDFEQQRRLADLPRAGQKLDPGRCGLRESPPEHFEAFTVAKPE